MKTKTICNGIEYDTLEAAAIANFLEPQAVRTAKTRKKGTTRVEMWGKRGRHPVGQSAPYVFEWEE
jgi:hypothetical protein